MQKITTFLMFDGKAEEAMNLYLSAFKESQLVSISHYGKDEGGTEGTVKQAVFSLNGQEYICMDSPSRHDFTFTPSISLFVTSDNEEDIDDLFLKMSADGKIFMPLSSYPFSKKFGWFADRFGVSWQLSLV